MCKGFKKFMASGLCAFTICGSISAINGATSVLAAEKSSTINSSFASTSIGSVKTDKPVDSGNVNYQMFTYENAPDKLKSEYRQNCEAEGKTPSTTDKLYVPSGLFAKYDIKTSKVSARSNSNFGNIFVEWGRTSSDIIIYVATESGPFSAYYASSKSSYVGNGQANILVDALQASINNWGLRYGKNVWVSLDGVWGPNTRNALITFQKWVGLPADGICGPNTWDALLRYSGAKQRY